MDGMICSNITRRLSKARSVRWVPALLGGLLLAWLAVSGCASPKPQPDLQLLTQAWDTIQRHYVQPGNVQPSDLTYGALSGMVDALGDTGPPTFLTPAMVKELKNMERGEFKGVGLEIRIKACEVAVVAPIDDSPAQRAGCGQGMSSSKSGGRTSPSGR